MYIIYNNKLVVTTIISNPSSEQMVENGFFVDDIPRANAPDGMRPVPMVNIETSELYYDYEVIPDITLPENALALKIAELEQSDIENKQAIAELTMMIAAPVGGDGR
ncbi:hypothetical protein DMN77_18550 [Paenibacillus sp. 79R4]|uniref:hypothetical protein n=1 Tax=Paenibacillus sp. 79R4 TaxID=2212847 RepID=UPI0015BE1394|nr:hypothetical protein [Paenibacillus sp. 79R4]NWL89552.1 hypothetical protein [Paenibacillus sp. 79R4]